MRIEDTKSMSVGSHRRCQHAENGQGCAKLATWGDPARRVLSLALCNLRFASQTHAAPVLDVF